jgi:hypothetical protein
MRPSAHHGRDNWRLSTIIIAVISLIFLIYLAFLFHIFILPSFFSNDSAATELILNEKDFIIKSLHRELVDYKNQTKLLESDIETLRQQVASHDVSPSDASPPQSPILNPLSGVVILGMHRSGTSIVGGLMNKMGLETGGPLIRPNFDNEKGFFERIDVVIQNDEIMKTQRIHYSYRTAHYNSLEGIKTILLSLSPQATEPNFFRDGSRALSFLNNPASMPWMLKDPRLCITLRTWLPFLSSLPAVLFTYRNPMDVALSMNTRETEHFPIGRGLKLWYIYNKRAIQQSHDLCRVVTSHRKMMSQPSVELHRIYRELRERCHVPVPHEVSPEDVNDFIDIKLQHGKTSLLDGYCSDPSVDFQSLTPPPEKWKTSDPNHLKLYRSSVQLYCDLENHKAYESGYQFDETIVDE